MVLDIEQKACSACQEALPVENFGRDSSRADGRRSQCKPCRNSARRESYAVADKDELKTLRAAYRQKNIERDREYHRRYSAKFRAENPDKCREYRKRYRSTPRPRCSVDYCFHEAREKYEGSLCGLHQLRLARNGTLEDLQLRHRRGPDHPGWKPVVGYDRAHRRIRGARGAPDVCVDCGSPADHWSYNHTSPDELQEEKRVNGKPRYLPYSLDPYDYDARCFGCHIEFDRGR